MITLAQIEYTQMAHELVALSRRDITQGVKFSKYKKNAGSMLKNDPVAGNALLGLVACLEHDLSAMHQYHKKAIELVQSSFTLMSYAASLEKSCLWNESAKYALFALDHEPENLQFIDILIRLAPLTGRFSLLNRLLTQWRQAHNGVQHSSHLECEIIGAILSRNGLLEKDLKLVIAAIGDALSETDVILQGFRCDLVTGRPEQSFIHYRFLIPDQFVASYYEDLIAEKLDSLAYHPRVFDAFSFSIENSTVYELYDYMEKELEESAETIRIPDPDKLKLMEELVQGVEI